jgi:D-alanyl-D-alanine carboxypeptidase
MRQRSRFQQAFHDSWDESCASLFGVPLAEARAVFFPVTRRLPLPESYAPLDLIFELGRPVRALVVNDLGTMLEAAKRDRADLVLVSGYRSPAYQATLFEKAIHRELRRGETIDWQEAVRRVTRFVARPGHSQHQLGTTVDLSSQEIRRANGRPFSETVACQWLARHAHEYGFVLPYTVAAEARTGYVAEPWHVRWVGRPLATLLHDQGYRSSGFPTADDLLLDVQKLLDAHATPPLALPSPGGSAERAALGTSTSRRRSG